MVLEIEFKAKAPWGIETRLSGWEFVGEWQEVDLYFTHPSVDFLRSDEALRLRESSWGRKEITYKGPATLNEGTRTRREITLPVEDSKEAQALLEALGFRPLAYVRKNRRGYRREKIRLTIDEVEGVGSFVEIEALGSFEDEEALKALVEKTRRELEIEEEERRTYLELVLGSASVGA